MQRYGALQSRYKGLQQAVQEAVQGRRAKTRLLQKWLSRSAKMVVTLQSLLESGKHQPSLGTMKALADALETSLAAMIAEAEGDDQGEGRLPG